MKYIFVHIGKTAGTSFRDFLMRNTKNHYFGYAKLHFLTHATPKYRDINKFHEVVPNSDEIFNQCDLFSEHAPYGLHEFLKTEEYQYITVLREPIRRTISAYNYSIDRKWITPETNIIEWFNSHEDNDIEHYQINHISGILLTENIDRRIEVALNNLKDEKVLFGFTEKYNEFIDLCCKVNNWEPRYKHSNKTSSNQEISDEEINQLKELLKDEIHFYNEAQKIYKEKYKNFIKWLV